MGVTFTNNKIDSAIVGSEQRYQSKINSAGVCSTDDLAAEVAANLKETQAFVSAFLREVTSVTQRHLAEGERVLLDGLCHLELYGEGTFASEDEAWDTDRHKIVARAVVYDAVKNAAADIVPTNTLSPVTIQLLGSQDATTYEQDCLTIGHTLLCQGKNLQITAANEDEGLFLVKDANEYKATITDNTAGTIDATFANTLPAGTDYTLEIRGRGGNGTNRMLVTAQITGFEVKAAT